MMLIGAYACTESLTTRISGYLRNGPKKLKKRNAASVSGSLVTRTTNRITHLSVFVVITIRCAAVFHLRLRGAPLAPQVGGLRVRLGEQVEQLLLLLRRALHLPLRLRDERRRLRRLPAAASRLRRGVRGPQLRLRQALLLSRPHAARQLRARLSGAQLAARRRRCRRRLLRPHPCHLQLLLQLRPRLGPIVFSQSYEGRDRTPGAGANRVRVETVHPEREPIAQEASGVLSAPLPLLAQEDPCMCVPARHGEGPPSPYSRPLAPRARSCPPSRAAAPTSRVRSQAAPAPPARRRTRAPPGRRGRRGGAGPPPWRRRASPPGPACAARALAPPSASPPRGPPRRARPAAPTPARAGAAPTT
eukprot:892177-Prorocentrum_minimum.AAC.5